MVEDGIPEDHENGQGAGRGADIYFGDAAHIRSDHHAGRTWGKKGETPIVATTGARYAMSLLSAITSKGRMRFMVKEKGGVNADVFIEFLKRLLVGETRKIFLIVDQGPAHRAKKTKAFVATLAGRLKLFFLPPYSPDRNPDELVWKHLKADTVGRMVVTDRTDFKSKVVSSLRSLQRHPGKICSFFQNLPYDTPNEYELTYGPINSLIERSTRDSAEPMQIALGAIYPSAYVNEVDIWSDSWIKKHGLFLGLATIFPTRRGATHEKWKPAAFAFSRPGILIGAPAIRALR
jgi:transposase